MFMMLNIVFYTLSSRLKLLKTLAREQTLWGTLQLVKNALESLLAAHENHTCLVAYNISAK